MGAKSETFAQLGKKKQDDKNVSYETKNSISFFYYDCINLY